MNFELKGFIKTHFQDIFIWTDNSELLSAVK